MNVMKPTIAVAMQSVQTRLDLTHVPAHPDIQEMGFQWKSMELAAVV
jgi:hypothetical protein